MCEDEINYFIDNLSLIAETTKRSNESLKQRELDIKAGGVKPIEVDDSGEPYDPWETLIYDSNRSGTMTQRMLDTLIVGILIFLEHALNLACTTLKEERQLTLSPEDLDGGIIKRSVKYLRKELGSDFVINDKLIEYLYIAVIIRNSIVHSNTTISKDSKNFPKISSYIKLNPDLLSLDRINDNFEQIILTEKYARELIGVTSKICEDLGKCMGSE